MKKPILTNVFHCCSLLCENCNKICNSEFSIGKFNVISCSAKCCSEFIKKANEKPVLKRIHKEEFEKHVQYQQQINETDLAEVDFSNFGLSEQREKDLKRKAKHLGINNWEFLKGLLISNYSNSEILSKADFKPKIATKEERKKYGVHITHCCIRHHCKYGDDDCPVAIGKLKQEHPCEQCGFDYDPKNPFNSPFLQS